MNKKRIGIGAAIATATVFCVASLVLMSNVSHPFVENIVTEEMSMQDIFLPMLGDADPGAGISGMLRMGVTKDGSTYTSNLTDGDWWEYTEVNDTHAGTEVPYGTNVYLTVELRWNATDAGNGTAGEYNLNYVEGWLNCTDLSISSQEMTEYNVTGCNNDLYVWLYYVYGPVTINKGQNITGVTPNFRAYK